MTRGIFLRIATAGAILWFGAMQPAARADEALFSIAGEPVTLRATLRAREEVWSWFGPGDVPHNRDENHYHFFGGFLRLGAGYKYEGVSSFLELMVPYLVNLPDDAIAPPPQGLLGLGANYYQPNFAPNAASVFLKQGYLEFGRELLHGFDLKGGRFEFFDGAEMMPADPELQWLVNNRIAQRLIGNFGFSDVQRSYDGAVASWLKEPVQVTAMYGVPTKGVFDLQGMDEIRNMDLGFGSIAVGSDPRWGRQRARVFYIYYHDGRGLSPIDNRMAQARNADRRAIEIHTVGADYVGVFNLGPGALDVLLWGGGQLGAWGHLKHEAWAGVAEAGYRIDSLPWRPWIRAGYTATSGDSNPNDSTHETFFQILPTPRPYAMFPFYNLMNLNDLMAQSVLGPTEDGEVRPSLHWLWLSASRDPWYSGGGAFDNKLFGYAGRPAFSRSYLATLLDCELRWKLNDHVLAILYYGHAFGGGVASVNYPAGKEADYAYVEADFSL